MPRPQTGTGVKGVLRFVTYLSKFLPKLPDIPEPLRKPTKKEIEYGWSNEQEKAFNGIKQHITAKPVLRYYDATKELAL